MIEKIECSEGERERSDWGVQSAICLGESEGANATNIWREKGWGVRFDY